MSKKFKARFRKPLGESTGASVMTGQEVLDTTGAPRFDAETIELKGIASPASSPLAFFGGHVALAGYFQKISKEIADPHTTLCAVVIDGPKIFPYDIPQILLSPDGDSARGRAQQLVFSAMMAGDYTPALMQAFDGKEAVPHARRFLEGVLALVSPELSDAQISGLNTGINSGAGE